MIHRAASPAISENEFDISNALAAGPGGLSDDDASFRPHNISSTVGNFLDSDDDRGALDNEYDPDGDEEFIAATQAASNRKSSNLKGKTVKKGGGFQAMGLNANLLKAITRKGFTVPTPIQRKTIPLVLEGDDVVGMARTGSGKTAAFVIPMIERLKAHSARVGARGVIMSPSRELALQTLKVVKELGRGTDLRTVLLVGGDSIEDQFGMMTSNPDIIIATPGRFLHLKVEMGLDLSSVKYVVFDEADRLFEMGFAAQLYEILHALPASRQTLLFSATLPKSLVEFAGAGRQEPKLVRLDADSKVSPDLQSAFFTVKSAEKEGALLHLLQNVIHMPTGEPSAARERKRASHVESNNKKRKRGLNESNKETPTEHSTIIFTATKHHVEYIASLLRASGYAVSHVYGSLDQTARKIQVQDFRTGMTNLLVVTDVAARGIDIPVLANVINYDFPAQPKIFVHRVGRTARAGRKGWSYSLVKDSDLPYLLDLQLFLSRRLIVGRDEISEVNFAEDVVLGSLLRDPVERAVEWVNKILDDDVDLESARMTAAKGEKLYMRTRNSASAESSQRSKDILASGKFFDVNMLFDDSVDRIELARQQMVAKLSGFRPTETIFEIGKRGGVAEADIMRKRREKIDPRRRQTAADSADPARPAHQGTIHSPRTDGHDDLPDEPSMPHLDVEAASDGSDDDEFEVTVSQNPPANKQTTSTTADSWKDEENFMSYAPRTGNLAEERGYGVHSGSYNSKGNSTFLEAARSATMDLNGDETKGFAEPSRSRGVRWDKRSKKYVSRANDEDGSKGAKMVRGESGQMIAASFRSGRFDAWKKSNNVGRVPRTGEAEASGHGVNPSGGRRFKHHSEKAPKEADKFRDDYHKRKKRVDEAKANRIGKFRDGGAKTELRGVDDVRKQRNLKEKRRQKNARPSKKRRL
jgi:ATP-dependent RNA helicase DDX54/DBP10